MNNSLTKERFLEDTKKHVMTIERDDSIFRSLIFKNENCSSYHFRITTWPDHLCISGDCGTYVFSRLYDMFEFFSNDDKSDELEINPGYWGEKLESICKQGGYKEFSEEIFIQRLRDEFEQWTFSSDLDKAEQWAEVRNNVIYYHENEKHTAMKAALDFCSSKGNEFLDFYEYNITDYTYHYIWCLYAIVWGINQYNNYLDGKSISIT